jgi:hypothetical protein
MGSGFSLIICENIPEIELSPLRRILNLSISAIVFDTHFLRYRIGPALLLKDEGEIL